jgi:hypothetical protein
MASGGPNLPSFPPLRDPEIHSVPPGATSGMAAYKFVTVLPQLTALLVCGAVAWKLLSLPGDHAAHAVSLLLGPIGGYMWHKSKPAEDK